MEQVEELVRLDSGVELCFDTFGDRANAPLLLVMGLAGPLTWWDADLCRMLAARGFFVIRFDNRDVGRSSRLNDAGGGRRVDVVRSFLRSSTPPPYTISDLAVDAFGLLDHLGIRQAHVTGMSMGGMIAQTMAIEHPERVLSLVSVMSTTGRRSVGWQDPRLLPRMLGRGRRDRDGFIAASVLTWAAIGSPGYPTSAEKVRARAGETFDRGVSLSGVVRQTQAVLAQPDRTGSLGQLTMPTLVIHGLKDRLVHVSGGRATARAIPGAELILVPGMGHDMPRELWPVLVDGIERTARRAAPTQDTPAPDLRHG